MSGKGSKTRITDYDAYRDEHDRIYGKKTEQKTEKIKSKLKRTFTRKPKRDK